MTNKSDADIDKLFAEKAYSFMLRNTFTSQGATKNLIGFVKFLEEEGLITINEKIVENLPLTTEM